ncbi:alkaline-phosphatase-like protein [Yarrowia lipolytica]|jgi:arylsulfatase A-like enzyme|uniref:YALI0D26488p n=2 Tax=Yarrowia lipolytica TaxID=4952 RepID=Q6C7P3_YARLI|nr:YALI0D26488p [Yarrowia lipolytica CLIB122]RDW26660.1 alkaline-phosphatase-like protein [Yarrowia lipolytica]RDW34351.1 alkaline-phosphatase-like protein [Yarrowia lipolytica]RDW39916.1 alkaline-phosphatase-like protein [Yarrowia lipolytica]CAG81525.1 YALI0D26488p [Yarrowia lipolytica CLIB122]|eukprot:XP_503319.1 YALI0D26488p [Yarrowia lipolytica CLIB122]
MPHSQKRPNFLIIVADDLGWSDTQPFGGEIHTPNLERLAKSGVRFTDFHTASACSPTRSMLFSGTDNHIAGLGQMAETVKRFTEFQGKPGYEGYLNDRVAALPELLSDAGYHTIMSGKWHLGLVPERFPSARGFQKSFALLPGGANHYAFEPGTKDKPAVPFLPQLYAQDKEYVEVDDSHFYSSDSFTDTLLEYIEEKPKDKPWFAYLPFTAPHWPLQAPKEYINKYKGKYDEGPDVLREQRLKEQVKLGLVGKDVVSAPILADNETEWHDKTAEEKAYSARTMEIYAAMVQKMDENIGRVLDHLEKTGEIDNTFISFMSDNGAEGAILEAIPLLTNDLNEKYFDNSIENIGAKNSFIWYGPRWAQAATAPAKYTKGYIFEGGIRCPLIVRYPGFENPGSISNEFTTVMDILPTVLELAGVTHPGTNYKGREVVVPKGVSWVSNLSGKSKEAIHSNTHFTGWELFGQRAIRKGNLKAILAPEEGKEDTWELYDLDADFGETKDLAKTHPDVLKELVELWYLYEGDCGVFIPDNADQMNLRKMLKENPRRKAWGEKK